jgi:carbamoyl-phosphate synthase large subunit
MTYGGDEDDIEFSSTPSKVIVFGAGVFRIGKRRIRLVRRQHYLGAKKNGIKEAIMVNYNPETVSTDYDVSDKLYFEELTTERILDIYEKENPMGIIPASADKSQTTSPCRCLMQAQNSWALQLKTWIWLKTAPNSARYLTSLGIHQPSWSKLAIHRRSEAVCNQNRLPSYRTSKLCALRLSNACSLQRSLHLRTSLT